MTILSKPLRRQLENTVKDAREIAEAAAKDAIARMGVADGEAPSHLSDENKALRRRLRAHARTLGDTRDATGSMTTARLQDAAAYEIWHRMLFGRFLVERGLLIHPDLGATVSAVELRELAQEEGAADEWALAERYAAPGLPGVFKPDDPVLALPIAPEFSKRLRAILSGLPKDAFTADDSLGWTYQFWRASEKDAVNAAGGKIGSVELPAVTQLFTESYMVKFLLHNTLGAWWAAKVLALDPDLARDAADEDALREACALPAVRWEFLRFIRDVDGNGSWHPAAGTFSGWPNRAAEITYCDPCCGSGHFLVEAFFILSALREKEEGISAADAAMAVLQDNLYGLEIDGRCVQIAAFNVALAAWKLVGAPISLPPPHIAWVGAPPPMSKAEMSALGNDDGSLRHALEALHDQFVGAPVLGSMLEVGARNLLDPDLRERGQAALAMLRRVEPERAEGAIAAKGLLDAVSLLGRSYVLQSTNVPFLGRGRQAPAIADFLDSNWPEAKADLATAMLLRIGKLSADGGTLAAVSPQGWLSLAKAAGFRRRIRSEQEVCLIARLGTNAFEAISGEVVSAALYIANFTPVVTARKYIAIDVADERLAQRKAYNLTLAELLEIRLDVADLKSPFSFLPPNAQAINKLSEFIESYHGITTTDAPRFVRHFWEIFEREDIWIFHQSTTDATAYYGGKDSVLRWENGQLLASLQRDGAPVVITGLEAWGRMGIVVNTMNRKVSLYTGSSFDTSVAVLCPKTEDILPALWAFCASEEFLGSVKEVRDAMNVEYVYYPKISWDADSWRRQGQAEFPAGLPQPYSDDPTQWLFHGHPGYSEPGTGLHVALARLAGYRWPAETDTEMPLSDLAKERIAMAAILPGTDADGLLPLHANGSDHPLADRLRALLAAAYGAPLSPVQEQALIRAADAKFDKKEARDSTLEGWLADRAFRQHCILFHQRPFLWQIWDGMKGGFSAFLNYHRLDNAALNTLTYTLLGDWIRTAKAEGNTARQERAELLQQKLTKIIEGENPYDIFVRWKPFAKQPLGWNPDLDDGVRLNIRPFMTAGTLREHPKGIAWTKDRGTDIPSAPWYNLGPSCGGKPGDRINDYHTTLAEKRAARSSS